MAQRRVERRADDEHARRAGRPRAQRISASSSGPPTVSFATTRIRCSSGGLSARRLPRPAPSASPCEKSHHAHDRGQHDEHRDAEPAVDQRRDHDQREVADRQPDEPERFSLAPEGFRIGAREDRRSRRRRSTSRRRSASRSRRSRCRGGAPGEKWPRNARIVITSRIVRPTKTCAPCRPVRPKNVAANDVSLVLKPMRLVLDHLREQEGQRRAGASAPCPAQSPARLPRLIDVSAQCIVKLEVTRISVLTPGDEDRPLECASGRPDAVDAVVDDAVEEVDREERAEEHDLRPDEEEHPEQRRGDPRAVVDRRRSRGAPWAVVPRRSRVTAWRSGEITWSTGRPVSLRSRSTRSRRSQPLRSPRERRDDDLVDPLVVRRLASPPCTDRGARPGRARRSLRRAAR